MIYRATEAGEILLENTIQYDRYMIREMFLCVYTYIFFIYIYTPPHLKDIQVFVVWKQKNQPPYFHKKEVDINR